MQNLTNALLSVIDSAIDSPPLLGAMLLLLWSVHAINALLAYRLNVFGIYPRRSVGLRGILFSPFLHGSAGHLFFNCIPLVVLATLILVNGQAFFFQVTAMIAVLSGVLTWLLGRRAFHVGASSVIMGYWSFLLVDAVLQRSALSIVLAALCLYYFAGMYTNIFPREEKTSWEGHLFGLLSGVAVSYVLVRGWVPALG